jgi:uncharacterized membrane protein YagU involved in acid resistance
LWRTLAIEAGLFLQFAVAAILSIRILVDVPHPKEKPQFFRFLLQFAFVGLFALFLIVISVLPQEIKIAEISKVGYPAFPMALFICMCILILICVMLSQDRAQTRDEIVSRVVWLLALVTLILTTVL